MRPVPRFEDLPQDSGIVGGSIAYILCVQTKKHMLGQQRWFLSPACETDVS